MKKIYIFLGVFMLIFLMIPLIGMLLQPGKEINQDKYDKEIRRILASDGTEYGGTRIIPYDSAKDEYVFDVEYHGKRLIPLKYVVQTDAQLGGVLEYEFSDSTASKMYRDEKGNNYKGFSRQLKLTLKSLPDGEELASKTFRSELPKQSEASYYTFVQPFSDKELEQIKEWIDTAVREHLGYE